MPGGGSTSFSLNGSNTVYSAPTVTPSPTSTSVVGGASSSNPPTIASGATNGGSQTLALGSSLELDAPFEADSSLTYQWYKDGSKLGTASAKTAALTIDSLVSTSYGAYYVVATNSLGQLSSQVFYVNPVLTLETLGSHDCNGSQCNNDASTANKVCQMRHGDTSTMAPSMGYGPSGVKWTTAFCTWTGTAWNCSSCTWACSGYNVLGYVYCMN